MGNYLRRNVFVHLQDFFSSLGKYKVKKRDAATDALHELAVAIVREKVRQRKIPLEEMDVSINSCLNKICKQNQADILKDVLSQSVKKLVMVNVKKECVFSLTSAVYKIIRMRRGVSVLIRTSF